MLTGRLVTEEAAPMVEHRVMARSEPSQALLSLLALARKAEKAETVAGMSRLDHEKPADPLAGVISRPVLRSLLAAMQYRHPGIVIHGRRTARIAVALATHLGWERPELTYLELAALLHDLGQVGVPDNILAKPSDLSADEAELLAIHQSIALDILAASRVHANVLAIMADAFPDADVQAATRRAGEINVGARILAVAEAFDTLRTDQPYRSAIPQDEALQLLADAKDERFDANVVAALRRLINESHAWGGPLTPHPADAELPPLPAAEIHEAAALGQIFSYMYILESLYDGFTLVDADLRYVLASRGATHLLGRSASDLHGKSWASRILPATDHEGRPLLDYELPLNRVLASNKAVTQSLRVQATGRWINVELQAVPLTDDTGRLLGIAEIFRNQSRASEPTGLRELKLAASRDPLTGLANRAELEAQLAESMKSFQKSGRPFAVLFLDADFFKQINDNYGHAVGDEVLTGLAKLLRQECYSGELLARYGGEEFIVVCPETDLSAARRRAERLRLAVSQSVLCADPDVRVTVSFGAAACEAGDTIESLIRRADKALYQAKRTGRNRTCSLSAADLAVPHQVEPVEERTTNPFLHVAAFRACLASDMAVFKLGGFLREENAVLSDVAPGRAVLRIGQGGFLGSWGRTGKRRPVEVRLEFADAARENEAVSFVTVRITIRPLGRIRRSEIFQTRAREVVGLLRSYFAADDA